VQFNSPEAAKAARDELHMQVMEVSGNNSATAAGQGRYVEVFIFSERPNMLKNRKTHIEGGIEDEGTTADASCFSKDQVVAECRAHMALPGKDQLLLSMLGVALSQGARIYLKTTDQGLKQLVSQYASEFTVKGPKGREYVSYVPICNSGQVQSNGLVGARAGLIDLHSKEDLPPWPASPQVRDPKLVEESPARLDTPSDWGTPQPDIYAGLRPHSGADLHGGPLAAATGVAAFDNSWEALALAAARSEWPGQGLIWEALAANTQPPPQVVLQTLAAATQKQVRQISEETPGVCLHGLPVNCTEQDVLAFFAKYDVVDRVSDTSHAVQIFPVSQQAVVQMMSRKDAHVALRMLNGRNMDGYRIDVSHYTWGESGLTEPQTACISSFTDKKKGTPLLDQQQVKQPGQPGQQQQQQQHMPAPNVGSFATFDGASDTGGSGNASVFGDMAASCKHEPLQAFPMQPWASASAPNGLRDSNSAVVALGQPCSHHRDVLMASGHLAMSLDTAYHSQTKRGLTDKELDKSWKVSQEAYQQHCPPQLRIA